MRQSAANAKVALQLRTGIFHQLGPDLRSKLMTARWQSHWLRSCNGRRCS